ncbi:MAG: UvrD-helicase domain-containing protein [Nakamurella sp.]
MTKAQWGAAVSPEELAAALGRPEPTEQQAAVISAPAEPTLVIAGAGSGKTETIAQRVVYVVANRIARPGDVLGLTFTRKAAGELSTRIRTRLRGIAAAGIGDPEALRHSAESQPEISTYHAFAGNIIAEFGPLVGIEPAARVLTPTATWQLARNVVRRWDGDLETDHSPERVTQDILDVSSALADHLVDLDSLDSELQRVINVISNAPPTPRQRGPFHSGVKASLGSLSERRTVLPMVRAFEQAKRAARVIDFADQMQLAAQIVSASSHAGAVLRARFPLVFLDEYQDTGHSQRIILRNLFGHSSGVDEAEIISASNSARPWRGHAVTAVGDPVQSIYSWRGASASNLQRFVTDFPKSDGTPARQRELLISFRNDRAVLDIANTVSQSVRRAPVPVGTLKPAESAEAGEVRAALLSTVDDENCWLAGELETMWLSRQEPPTVAVLVRRRASMAGIAQALRQRGLPVEVVGVGGLVDEPEVADIIAMLRLVVDHQSGPAAVRILTGARWRLGISDVAALSRRARDLGTGRTHMREPRHPESEAFAAMRAALADAIGSDDVDDAGLVDAIADPGESASYSDEGWRRISVLRGELQRLRAQLAAPLTELVRDIERTLRLDVEVLLSPDGRTHLDAFGDVVADIAASGAGPVELLDYLVAASEREDGLTPGEVEVAEGRIQVLTVHAAKGLEWDVVAVPHLSAGVFPSSMNSVWLGEASGLPPALRGDRDDVPDLLLLDGADQGELGGVLKKHREQWKDRHLTEERRLFYVAITRARHSVLLSAHHWSASRKEPAGPGEFFAELVDCVSSSSSSSDTVTVSAPGGSNDPRPLVTPEICAGSPAPGSVNPLLDHPITGVWPVDPLGTRRPAILAAAQRVRQARIAYSRADADFDPVGIDLARGTFRAPCALSDASDSVAAGGTETAENDPEGWFRDMRLLLAERAAAFVRPPTVDVGLPSVLPVSTLVQLSDDPQALARRLLRPLPHAPSPQARRGTAFHSWLEHFYGGEPLLDVTDLPGAHDREAADDQKLGELIDAFRSSPWAARTPIAVEVPFVTHVAGVAIRGRIDAVFSEPDGGVCVVDWKTGVPPGPDRARSVAIQLIAYRLAWARLHKMPLEHVRAAFYYVAHDRTVTPTDLMDAGALARIIDESVEEPSAESIDGFPSDVRVRADGAAKVVPE